MTWQRAPGRAAAILGQISRTNQRIPSTFGTVERRPKKRTVRPSAGGSEGRGWKRSTSAAFGMTRTRAPGASRRMCSRSPTLHAQSPSASRNAARSSRRSFRQFTPPYRRRSAVPPPRANLARQVVGDLVGVHHHDRRRGAGGRLPEVEVGEVRELEVHDVEALAAEDASRRPSGARAP